MRRAGGAWPGLILAGLSLLVNLLWVAAIKPLDAPDEPAHLQAIMVVRNQHNLPEVHYRFPTPTGQVVGDPGDAGVRAYTQTLRRGTFVLIPYESMQAPLYYVVAGVAALALPPDPATVLYLSRLIAALFGAGAVFFCWAAVRALAPAAPGWAVAVAGTIALLPQFGFNSASASNDSAFNCLAAAALYVWIRGLRDPATDPWLLRGGALLGLAVLTKLTGLTLGAGLALVVLCRAFQGPTDRLQRGLRLALGGGSAALAVCGPWLVRNWLVYGEPSGSRDAFRFYHGRFKQLDLFDPAGRAAFLQQTWESFWGRFGWMSVRLPDVLYTLTGYVALALLALSVVAAVRALRRRRAAGRPMPAYVWQTALVLAAVALGIAAGYLQYNIGVNIQAQGRYLFALLLPYGLVLTGGLYALAPAGRARAVALALPLAGLAGLNALGLVLTALH